MGILNRGLERRLGLAWFSRHFDLRRVYLNTATSMTDLDHPLECRLTPLRPNELFSMVQSNG